MSIAARGEKLGQEVAAGERERVGRMASKQARQWIEPDVRANWR